MADRDRRGLEEASILVPIWSTPSNVTKAVLFLSDDASKLNNRIWLLLIVNVDGGFSTK
jgi:hypothetical protein